MSDAVLAVAVPAAGGLGALSRYGLDETIRGWTGGRSFPLGIFVVNLSAAFIAGLLAAITLGHATGLIVVGGFLGGFSTFSTWIVDSVGAVERGRPQIGVVNVAASLILGLLAAGAGWLLAGG